MQAEGSVCETAVLFLRNDVYLDTAKYADTAINVDFKLSDGLLEMRIQDHGQGISSDEIELITNKFYRGKKC